MFYLGERVLSEFAYQMAAVAVGWQVYALTHSALALGMLGLVQFIPTAALTFLAGHLADRYDRRRVVGFCQLTEAITAAILAWSSFAGLLTVSEIYAAVFVFGAAIAFESPASAALLPGITPPGMLQRSSALATGGFQVAMISGPAIGGVIYTIAPGIPYLAMTGAWLLAASLSNLIVLDRPVAATDRPSFRALFAGVAFMQRNQAIMGAISLDLFAVLLGGATVLLPIYTRDILHTGPWGLGLMRAAPAVGALLMAVALAHHSITRKAGFRLFQAVLAFGVATIVFALSHVLWLSLLALAALGAADTVSMVIRMALVQFATPDDMRGRVGAVNFLFVNASYQLGEFESGVTAALFGAMQAVVLGGVGTIIIALLWMQLFPALRNIEQVE